MSDKARKTVRELMTKAPKSKSEAKRQWTRPTLNRLGTIKDVAGPSGAGAQAAGGGQNRS
jgi:hypothetical protein